MTNQVRLKNISNLIQVRTFLKELHFYMRDKDMLQYVNTCLKIIEVRLLPVFRNYNLSVSELIIIQTKEFYKKFIELKERLKIRNEAKYLMERYFN